MKSTLALQSISLRQTLPRVRISGAEDIRLRRCCHDSRRIDRGDLFVAVVGSEDDGHRHVAEAVGRGASAVLAERAVPPAGVPLAVVPNSREAYARLCQVLAGDPGESLAVIGVSGTHGKTTVTSLIASVFHQADYRVGLSGTLGACDSRSTWTVERSTPAAESLADWLARCRDADCTHAVLEASSRGLSRSRIAGIPLHAACITNVEREHLDHHGTLENYRRTKRKLLDQLAPGGVAVLNRDDPVCGEWLPELDGPVLTFGMNPESDVSGRVLERHRSEQTFAITAGTDTAVIRTAMIGDHHVANCLAAVAVALACDLDWTSIQRGLEAIDRMPGRLERIECGQPFGVFVDMARTPAALRRALGCLRQVTPGRLICVFGTDGVARGEQMHMARVLERAADLAVLTRSDTTGGATGVETFDPPQGFSHAGSALVEPDRAAAIGAALAAAEPGDCVLIAGGGSCRSPVVEAGPLPWNDAGVAREWLYAAASVDALPGQTRRLP